MPRSQLRASTTPRRLAQHLGGVHKDALLWMQHRRRRKEPWHRLLASGTLSLHQDRLHRLAHRAWDKVPTVRQCQKCQKSVREAFGTFGTLSVSVFGESMTPYPLPAFANPYFCLQRTPRCFQRVKATSTLWCSQPEWSLRSRVLFRQAPPRGLP